MTRNKEQALTKRFEVNLKPRSHLVEASRHNCNLLSQFRGLDDELTDSSPNANADDEDSVDFKEDEEYDDGGSDDAASSLLSSDLAFYMPQESASSSNGGSASGKKNKKGSKDAAGVANTKRIKSQSTDTKPASDFSS